MNGKDRRKGKVPEVPVRQAMTINHDASGKKKQQCQRGSSCDYWHPPECANYKTKNGCRWKDKCVFMHTSKSGDEKGKTSGTATLEILVRLKNLDKEWTEHCAEYAPATAWEWHQYSQRSVKRVIQTKRRALNPKCAGACSRFDEQRRDTTYC